MTTTLTANNSATNNRNKKVSFLELPDRVQDVPAIDDYTDEEYQGTWQTDEDDKSCQTEIIKTARLARDNDGTIPQGLEESEQVTSRGIEGICAGAAQVQQLFEAKQSVIDAVLNEQERQENQGATALDGEAIMRASKANSSRSSAEALARAAEDAAFALQEARISD